MTQPHAEHPYAPLLPIFLIVIVDVFGFTLVLPMLPIYAESLHATPLRATLLISVYAACQLVSGPLIGQISDRIGRKPMLLLSQVGTFIGFIVMARAQTLWVLYLARVIDGSTAGNLSIAQAYISDNTEPKNRAQAFAWIGIAFGLGFFLGPALSGFLVGRHGMTAPIYLAAGMSATSILCTAVLLRSGKPPQAHGAQHADPGPGGRRIGILNWGRYVPYFERPALRGLLFQFLCYMICFSLFISGFTLFAERRFLWHGLPWTPREVGYLFGYVGFLGIILQGGLIGRLVKRFGEARLVRMGFVSLIVGYLGLGLAHSIAMLIVSATISSFGNGVLRPSLTSLITQQAGRHEQGLILGLTQSLMSGASIVAPVLAGLMINHEALTLWAWSAAAAAGAGLMLATLHASAARLAAPRQA